MTYSTITICPEVLFAFAYPATEKNGHVWTEFRSKPTNNTYRVYDAHTEYSTTPPSGFDISSSEFVLLRYKVHRPIRLLDGNRMFDALRKMSPEKINDILVKLNLDGILSENENVEFIRSPNPELFLGKYTVMNTLPERTDFEDEDEDEVEIMHNMRDLAHSNYNPFLLVSDSKETPHEVQYNNQPTIIREFIDWDSFYNALKTMMH